MKFCKHQFLEMTAGLSGLLPSFRHAPNTVLFGSEIQWYFSGVLLEPSASRTEEEYKNELSCQQIPQKHLWFWFDRWLVSSNEDYHDQDLTIERIFAEEHFMRFQTKSHRETSGPFPGE